MKNWKYDLYLFRRELSLDQFEISSIVERHLQNFDSMSEKQLTESLKANLSNYSYDNDVKKLIESLDQELESMPLVYELKNLYKQVENRNYGMLYREPLRILLEAINLTSEEDKMVKILNELSIHSWVPEIKQFIYNLQSSPEKRADLLSGGQAETVYTLVEAVENGHVAYINKSWFLLSEDKIEKTLLEEHITDVEKLTTLRTLK